ncbi:PspC domain-containing protein [Carboxydochorda subterranea]|uniref:PspC domain-containing protein n=1 Tax=Carboxydichorda subterranea TaxID=3109565 RepID=A0ABZ1BY91_9FIRM|nr:PspC domain-containing protein [Limnochorda sp. L945t]WRP17772.1 PspC domain-containing protein [Limnochorda sp. L945t]
MATTPLYRPTRGAMVFGVCAGLGRYFDVDPVLIRLSFVLLAFFGGLGIVAYVVLALVMPSERSVAQGAWDVVRENARELGQTVSVAGQSVSEAVRSGGGADRRRRLFGVFLIALGGVIVLANLGIFWWVRWDILWPTVLIGLGLLLVLRSPRP